MTQRRKLIEVDLPLAAINAESAREKSLRHGHPSTLHLYWARRPLAACRAVIFASLVDDPEGWPEEFPTKEAQQAERERLHKLIERLVVWENVQPDSEGDVVGEARREIARSLARGRPSTSSGRTEVAPTEPEAVLAYLREHAPPLHDPFAGGGSIPLEAQRLGLRAIASDLNPLAVLINKALIELPPKFRNQPPVNPDADPMGMTVGKGRKARQVAWRGAAGLADDIRYYGRWMRDEAYKRIGHLYPDVRSEGRGVRSETGEEGPDASNAASSSSLTSHSSLLSPSHTVIAWLWARTVPCPNPACGVRMPLLRTFQLSKKKGNEHWTRPVVDREAQTISFVVQNHDGGVPSGGTVSRRGAVCLACQTAAPLTYVRERGRAGEMGEQMTAIVAAGDRKRLFLSPHAEHVRAAQSAQPRWRPSGSLPDKALGFRVQAYGFTEWHQLFTQRQLTGLTTLSNLLAEVSSQVAKDGGDEVSSTSVCTYLALAIGRSTDMHSRFVPWRNVGDFVAHVFSRQAISMVWDFAEGNLFSNSTGNWAAQVEWVARAVDRLPANGSGVEVYQADAASDIHTKISPIIITDPPYYDNIGYADLSDFFYVWLRPLLRKIHPDLFSGILTPKTEEMVAIPSRFKDARQRFEELLSQALGRMRERSSSKFPVSIFYAYKQQEQMRGGRASTGWETMLNAATSVGFQIVGTWPMRTELANRPRSLGSNALASSVVLVCRPRPADASVASRRQFLDELAHELPPALDQLTREGHIAPTDLPQAAIGPGIKVYSQYSRVETISGERVTVREALAAINQVIDAYEEQQEGELDAKTRFCRRWLQQHGHADGPFGDAEVLSQAGNVVIDDLASEGLLTAGGGKVRLLPLDEYHEGRDWPRGDMTAWEGCHRMAWHMNREDGRLVEGAAEVAGAMDGDAEMAERLARLLYSHFDRTGDSANAVVFNSLVTAWPDILEAAQRQADAPSQAAMSLGSSK